MNAAPDRISLQHVDMRFNTERGELKVVDDVSLTIREGEFVALVGPSGCGKTTLLNMMAGFIRPTGGHVLLDGTAITGPGRDRGVMFQEYGVFPWLTVKENIAFGLRLAANRVPAAEREDICQRYMRLMRLTDFANAYPKTLSGGMRQRVALARAYAVNPSFLLMDEPFGALDALTREEMSLELLRLWAARQMAVLFVTHSIPEAVLLADRVVVMSPRPGRVVDVIEVDLKRPRSFEQEGSDEFHRCTRRIRAHIFGERDARAA